MERSRFDCIPVRVPSFFWLWEQFNEVVNTKDGDGSLCGKLQALGLDHGGLVHTSLTVVSRFAIHQV